MLPVVSGITELEAYKDNEIRKKFHHAEGYTWSSEKRYSYWLRKRSSVQAGFLTNQHIIEQMFQDIITNGKDPKQSDQEAEKQFNDLFETITVNIKNK